MVTFRNNSNNNNNRRNNFRRSERSFKNNSERQKFGSSFSNGDNFKRKAPGRNNHNAPKLIEKYNDLAREALSNGDKILSENYLQHADHFTRVLNEKESLRREKFSQNISNDLSTVSETDNNPNSQSSEKDLNGESLEDPKIEKSAIPS